MKEKNLKLALCNVTGLHHYKGIANNTELNFFWNQVLHGF